MSAVALAASLALLVAGRADAKLVYVQGKTAVVVYVGHPLRQPIPLTEPGPPRWSGDGRLISISDSVRRSPPVAPLIRAVRSFIADGRTSKARTSG